MSKLDAALSHGFPSRSARGIHGAYRDAVRALRQIATDLALVDASAAAALRLQIAANDLESDGCLYIAAAGRITELYPHLHCAGCAKETEHCAMGVTAKRDRLAYVCRTCGSTQSISPPVPPRDGASGGGVADASVGPVGGTEEG